MNNQISAKEVRKISAESLKKKRAINNDFVKNYVYKSILEEAREGFHSAAFNACNCASELHYGIDAVDTVFRNYVRPELEKNGFNVQPSLYTSCVYFIDWCE